MSSVLKIPLLGDNRCMPAPVKSSNPEVSKRLTLLREALEIPTHVEFAARYGFSMAQWNNFERGFALPRDSAIRLVQQIHGLSLDWLYFGNTAGMASGLLRKIEQIEQSGKAESA